MIFNGCDIIVINGVRPSFYLAIFTPSIKLIDKFNVYARSCRCKTTKYIFAKACICVPNVVFIEVPKTLGYTKAFAMLEASQLPKAKFARYFSKKDSVGMLTVYLIFRYFFYDYQQSFL